MIFVHLPHHDGSPAYVPAETGQSRARPALGETIQVRVEIPHTCRVDDVAVRATYDAEPVYRQARRIEQRTNADVWEADVCVRNPLTRYRFLLRRDDGNHWLTQLGLHDHDMPDVFDFGLVADDLAPDWPTGAVLYQIFPDRFARSGELIEWPEWAQPADWGDPVDTSDHGSMHQLYGGDLRGVVRHLDHIADLGATTVYLTPFFPGAHNHRYNATSFDRVDPLLGGDDALCELATALHRRDMRLLGDLTVNHSGDGHTWFRTAATDPASPEAAFYLWNDHPHDYEAWAGVPTLPKFDHRSPELRRRLYDSPDSVAARWLKPPFNLDGWRVDAANTAGRAGHIDQAATLRAMLLRTVRAARPDAYLLAEHAHDAAADLRGDGWHGTTDYAGFTRAAWSWLKDDGTDLELMGMPLATTPLPGPRVVAALQLIRAQLPWRSVIGSTITLSSHDTARWATVTTCRARRHVGFAWQFTFPGIPCLYYGDEIGLTGSTGESGRTPMPWHIPDQWDREILGWVRRLIQLRRSAPALCHGGLRWLHVGDDRLVFLRTHPEQPVLVDLTRAASGPTHIAPGLLETGRLEPLLADQPVTVGNDGLTLPATDRPSASAWALLNRVHGANVPADR